MDSKQQIIDIIKHKSVLKQDIYSNIIEVFSKLKGVLKETVESLQKEIEGVDKRILLEYNEKGAHEVQICVAGDILIFHMHTNVFKFDENHSIWKSGYLKEDEKRGYCGIINIYNFLADSFKFNRINDAGYLVGRIFVNSENHFIVEGKRKLGFLYNDFANSNLDEQALKSIIENIILYTINFDLYTPPYDAIKEVSVYEMKTLSDSMQLKTGKRLGFQFSADWED